MPLPTSKIELLGNLNTAYAKLIEEAAAVPLELERSAELEGGISTCDLIAYQIGWGRLLLSWDDLERCGESPQMPAAGYKWNQLGALASSFYREHSDQELKQLLLQFDEVMQRMRRFIETSSEETLFGVGKRQWAGPKWPLAKWIQVNAIAPYASARAKLRKWKKANRSALQPVKQ